MTSSRSRSTDQRYYGLAEGIVEDNVDPRKLGRVKLRYPWFDEREITEWCRVAQPYAGNEYGAFYMPEKGDEVAVVFVHGDMRLGVVIGGLYNGQDRPPSHRSADLDQKMFKTKGGHTFILDDTSGSEHVLIKTNGGHVVKLDDGATKISITSNAGNSITLDDGSGAIEVSATSKISLSAPEITIDASGSVSITGGTVSVHGQPIKLN